MNKKVFLVLVVLVLSLGLVSADSCTDTDSGNDPYINGAVTLEFTNGSSTITYTDSCSGSTSYYSTEYYCSGDSIAASSYYCNSCSSPTVCAVPSYTYVETDGGNDPLLAGTVTRSYSAVASDGTVIYISGSSSSYEDKCYSGSLKEYYVTGSSFTYSSTDCDATYGSEYSCITVTNLPDFCGISCMSDSDCDSGYACSSGSCQETEEEVAEETVEVTCVDSDCGAYVCDASSSSCYTECTFSGGAFNTAVTTECTTNYACSSSLTCEEDADEDTWVDSEEVALGAACDSLEDSECAQGYCDSGLCVECETTAHCNSGETCSSGECVTATEICTGGSDEDLDETVDFGGIDTDGDGDIEYIAGCVKRSTFVKYGAATSATNNGCPRRSTYQCQDISTSAFSSCPSGTYISGDSECSMTSTTRASAPETESEQGFWARLWSWLTGK